MKCGRVDGKIPYFGDVVNDAEQGCAILSGDTLVECLTEEFKPKRVVFVSGVEGIFTANRFTNGPCDLCRMVDAAPALLPRSRSAVVMDRRGRLVLVDIYTW